MAKGNEGQTLREYGKRKKRYRRGKMFFFCALFFTIAVIGILYVLRLYNKTYQSYEVIKSIPNEVHSLAGYLEAGSSVVRYSRDGAVAIARDGDLLWNGAYEMNDPIADSSGKYVAIADRGNKAIHIYNEKGEVGPIKTLHDIIKIEVASQGVVAVLMEEGEINYLSLYSKDGRELIEGKVTDFKKEGYPMDISLSEDGKKLVVSYLTINSGELISTVSFYNFGEVGKSHTDGFVGGYSYEGIVVPRVSFLDNNTVAAFKEDGIMLYSMKEKPELIIEETYETEIKSILYNTMYAGLVLAGNNTSDQQIILYDLKGEKTLNKKIDFKYHTIYLTGDEIILYDTLSCLVLKTDGSTKFEYTFESNIEGFFPINQLDRYFLIHPDEISSIQLLE
ncbi:hypothetical protein I5677_09490 [Mobilitalea sibirica]|uniref:Uncharacterized protein n=1 Tax=Mobilitalea sibirica TaxID=1462919 RepID=A0A8J7L2P8_9FIRM|nr:DUF5711 family protein [Mobilitalea sibirica]MBH1941123.1 hypothetical protein [Mobilitalea sibirica]